MEEIDHEEDKVVEIQLPGVCLPKEGGEICFKEIRIVVQQLPESERQQHSKTVLKDYWAMVDAYVDRKRHGFSVAEYCEGEDEIVKQEVANYIMETMDIVCELEFDRHYGMGGPTPGHPYITYLLLAEDDDFETLMAAGEPVDFD